MSERFEEAVIAHCAPTLAGHKCGSLFSWRKTGGQDLAQELSSVNRLLQPKGVRVRLLKCCPAGALVYVYRPAMLHKRLERTDIADFLHGQGYASLKLSDALESHPVCVVPGEGMTFEMEKYFKRGSPEMDMKAEKVLELNASHPMFAKLQIAVAQEPEKAKKIVEILYAQALLMADLPLEDPGAYSDLVCELLG